MCLKNILGTYRIRWAIWSNSIPWERSSRSSSSRQVSLLEALSNVIHPIYKIVSIAYNWAKIHTLCAIAIRSRTSKKACARWTPVWCPGTRWKPMRSALKLRQCCNPSGVWIFFASIQWAVTAMNGVRFGSDHKSIVNEIFPSDFCQFDNESHKGEITRRGN